MRVLEVNVDDLHSGGVFALVKNVIINNRSDVKIDIGAIEKFENPHNLELLGEFGTNVYYLGYEGSKWKKQIVCYRNLKKLLKEDSYDCVHIHADVANKILVSGLAAKHAGVKKIILHSHSAGVDGGHRGRKTLFHKCSRLFLKRIGTDFVACSDLAAKWMFPNIRKENITIINNGVDLEKFRFDIDVRKKVRQELGVSNEILIGHVGRFSYQKNHEYLIAIMREIKKQNVDAKLLLIGEGPREREIYDMVLNAEINDMVIFYGVSDKVPELMQGMDIFILPSHFEGLPIVGVEAQGAGLPVIYSDLVTKEAKLIGSVEFLPIDRVSIQKWVDCIRNLTRMNSNREDAYFELKRRKFNIRDTVNSFLTLYGGS